MNPNDINEGYEVTIRDDRKRLLRGPMFFTEDGRMAIEAFGMEIPFARWSSSANGRTGGWVMISDIAMEGILPTIEGM